MLRTDFLFGRNTMNAPNGHAQADPNSSAGDDAIVSDLSAKPAAERFSSETVKKLVAELEVPFETSVIEWGVTNTGIDGRRGQIVPYANPRAYTDRLNTLFTPAGWTRKYTVNTSANFERAKDKKIVAKILVTCELTIFSLGSHSATGEEFADSEYALTAAEAQAFRERPAVLGLAATSIISPECGLIWIRESDPRMFPSYLVGRRRRAGGKVFDQKIQSR
jgi:hypothetical protein